jgi:hypothetical protein
MSNNGIIQTILGLLVAIALGLGTWSLGKTVYLGEQVAMLKGSNQALRDSMNDRFEARGQFTTQIYNEINRRLTTIEDMTRNLSNRRSFPPE